MRLFSYKLTHDTGFAPNPFWGVLTLATCKPGIRGAKRKEDWIAGFTSRTLTRNRDKVGEERLIFLMQITDVIDQYEYFNHPDPVFQAKIPDCARCPRTEFVYHAGDNIYRPLTNHPQTPGDFEQVKNPNHNEADKMKDLSGRWVLVSSKFYYFGGNPREAPPEVRPIIPGGQARYGFLTHDVLARAFVEWVQRSFCAGVADAPHKWPKDDTSWRNG
jgi:hypothetical protein